MTDGKHDDEKKVGYKNPPKATQFKKGQSGNPKGRRRTEKTPAEVITEVAREKIWTTINGRKKRLGMFEAALRSVLARTLQRGNLRELDHLLDTLAKHGISPHEVEAEGAKAGAEAAVRKIFQTVDRLIPRDEDLVEVHKLEEAEVAIIHDCPRCRPAIDEIWIAARDSGVLKGHKTMLQQLVETVMRRNRAA